MEESEKISAIQEAMRVIKGMDDKSGVYRNRMNVLFSALDPEEDAGAIEYWEELFDQIVADLEQAEESRKELLESMETHLDILKPENEFEPPSNPHPLLKRSGKR